MLCLSVSTPDYSLKIAGARWEMEPRDFWFASPMLYQLNYEFKSVRVFDISQLSLVASISAPNDLQLVEHWTIANERSRVDSHRGQTIFQLARCGHT